MDKLAIGRLLGVCLCSALAASAQVSVTVNANMDLYRARNYDDGSDLYRARNLQLQRLGRPDS